MKFPNGKFFSWLLFGVLILASFALAAAAADLNYPYGQLSLSVPPAEIVFPGMGYGYSALPGGIRSAIWNPALLGKLNLSESEISVNQTSGLYALTSTRKIAETLSTIEAQTNGSTPAAQYGVFYRTPESIGAGLNTKEVEMISTLNAGAQSTGFNYSAAMKVNDWLAVGFATNNPIQGDIGLNGSFPVTYRLETNFFGQKLSDNLQIGADGKLKYTYNQGGVVATYESNAAVWSGYLSQEATLPLTSVTAFKNNFNLQSPYMGTLAARAGKFCFGLNMLPINASTNIENDQNIIVNPGTQNIAIYVPGFDPTSQASIQNWVTTESQYSTQAGYEQKQILLPAGQIVATAKYRGFYAASAARFDLGGTYDINDWVTLGLALENIGGTTLNFKGSGLSTYVSYRDTNTAEAANLGDFFLPGGMPVFDYISNRWITTSEVSGTNLSLEQEKTYSLPKRTRIGLALKRPFTIALDYELNSAPLTIPGTGETTLSGLGFIHLGAESQLFALPLVLRFGTTLMLKPTVNTADSNMENNINKLFKYGVLPLQIDLGSSLKLWGVEIGDSLGLDATPALNILQFDTGNDDLSRLVYLDLFVRKDVWTINYLIVTDVLGTYSAYHNRSVPVGETKQFSASDLRFINTLGVTYRF